MDKFPPLHRFERSKWKPADILDDFAFQVDESTPRINISETDPSTPHVVEHVDVDPSQLQSELDLLGEPSGFNYAFHKIGPRWVAQHAIPRSLRPVIANAMGYEHTYRAGTPKRIIAELRTEEPGKILPDSVHNDEDKEGTAVDFSEFFWSCGSTTVLFSPKNAEARDILMPLLKGRPIPQDSIRKEVVSVFRRMRRGTTAASLSERLLHPKIQELFHVFSPLSGDIVRTTQLTPHASPDTVRGKKNSKVTKRYFLRMFFIY